MACEIKAFTSHLPPKLVAEKKIQVEVSSQSCLLRNYHGTKAEC